MTDEQYAKYRDWCIGRIGFFASRGKNARTTSLTSVKLVEKKTGLAPHEAESALSRMRADGYAAFNCGTWWVRGAR